MYRNSPKFVINGSILNGKFAVERLDKKITLKEKKNASKISDGLLNMVYKTFSIFFFGKNWTKSSETKASQVVSIG